MLLSQFDEFRWNQIISWRECVRAFALHESDRSDWHRRSVSVCVCCYDYVQTQISNIWQFRVETFDNLVTTERVFPCGPSTRLFAQTRAHCEQVQVFVWITWQMWNNNNVIITLWLYGMELIVATLKTWFFDVIQNWSLFFIEFFWLFYLIFSGEFKSSISDLFKERK